MAEVLGRGGRGQVARLTRPCGKGRNLLREVAEATPADSEGFKCRSTFFHTLTPTGIQEQPYDPKQHYAGKPPQP